MYSFFVYLMILQIYHKAIIHIKNSFCIYWGKILNSESGAFVIGMEVGSKSEFKRARKIGAS